MIATVFPDSGFRLGVLDALLRAGQLDEERLGERLADIREPDAEADRDDEDRWIGAALIRLAELELDPAQLAEIEAIHFDGGNDIYMLIEETLDIDTGGETDHYQVQSLVGIDRVPGLRSLNLDGHGYRKAAIDLEPLRDHPTLARLRLSGKCVGAAALEHMPALTHVDLGHGSLDDPSVLDRLAGRGVEISGRPS